ncbi:hypothetical protein SLOPH_2745 [Spraguea lophii 42_110]|uniref:Yip1 domain-containing protein n=1 Tax=Spraguea lophii (strain 42_110) TaxID=1358809 RepID=S7W5U2_SPRLO|nr:hypothetical protein SLOPH_2745 [Spraguea lophii 42_110]
MVIKGKRILPKIIAQEQPSEAFYLRRSLQFKPTRIKEPHPYDIYFGILYNVSFCIIYLVFIILLKLLRSVLYGAVMHTLLFHLIFSSIYLIVPMLLSYCFAAGLQLEGYTFCLFRMFGYSSLYNFILFPIFYVIKECLSGDYTSLIVRAVLGISSIMVSIVWYLNIEKVMIHKGKYSRFVFIFIALAVSLLYTILMLVTSYY